MPPYPKNIHRVVKVEGLFLTHKIWNREFSPYSGVIHNLEVEKDNSFTVENIEVHNSWFADSETKEKEPKVRFF